MQPSAVGVPLPPSPTKGAFKDVAPDTPRPSKYQQQQQQQQFAFSPPSSASPDYDRMLQEQLQRDMGGMNLGLAIQAGPTPTPARQATQPSTLQQRASAAAAAMNIAEIPPFRGSNGTPTPPPHGHHTNMSRSPNLPPQAQFQSQFQPQVRVPSSTSTSSQQTGFVSKSKQQSAPYQQQHQQPYHPPASSGFENEREHENPTVFPSPAPPNPSGDADALNDVIFPALEEALKRRQIRLQALLQNRVNGAGDGGLTPSQQRAEQAHKHLRTLVYQLAHVCKAIDQYDKLEPVGMGPDAGSFLEGLLAEILARVEPLDEEAV
jgi:serine/threonine-protein kinase 24/25/MST4